MKKNSSKSSNAPKTFKLRKFIVALCMAFKRHVWVICGILIILGAVIWVNRETLKRVNPLEFRHLQYIEIEGNRMLSWDDIVQNAQIEPGMLFADINEDSIRKNLQQIPLISFATIEKKFPSSLRITVKETSPILSVFENGKATVYSERGLPLPYSMTTALHLPIMEFESLSKVKMIASFLYAMQTEDVLLYDRVSQILWNENDKAIKVFFDDVEYSVLFPQKNWNRNLFELYELVKWGFPQEMKCAREVDLRFAGFAYVRNFDKRCIHG